MSEKEGPVRAEAITNAARGAKGATMNEKATPQATHGPWEPLILDRPLAEIPRYVEQCVAASGGGDFYFVGAEDERGRVDVAHIGNGPRGLANARLIAAAPDLLGALQFILAFYEPRQTYLDTEAWKRAEANARAAVAKATGASA